MKTHDLQWYDLFHLRGTRRDFLRLGSSVAGLVALGGCKVGGTGDALRRVASYPFTLGVASGEPAPDSVVLWTRLAREALEGVGAADRAIDVGWEIAADEGFSNIVGSGGAVAPLELGHSVHVEAGGLEPGREYFYRFHLAGETSAVGRTKTAPALAAANDLFRFAFASCQQYEHGYYAAYRHMAEENLDLIVHLGDYIYERTWGENLVRHHEGPEIMTLDDYRARYTTYKTDEDLQAAHASAPWVVTWDDHEVDNNYADLVPEDDQTLEAFALRRAAAYQAYYEFMPLRTSTVRNGPDMDIYRALRFGNLMEMNVLDTRQYRSDQACGDRTQPSCAEHADPSRTLLGQAQREWLFERLATTDATWNVLAQQIMVGRMRGVNDMDEETWSMDMWDGYHLERQAMIDVMAENDTPNPVVLTGDIHSNWVTDVQTDYDDERSRVVGTEFVGTSISSGGDGQDFPDRMSAFLDRNPHIKFYNGQRGYVTGTLTPERWTADYKILDRVSEPGQPIRTRATFVVEAGRPGAQQG